MKCVSTRLVQRLVTTVSSKLRFVAGTGKRLDHFTLTRFMAGSHIPFPLFHSPLPFTSLSLPSCLAKIILNSLPSFRGRIVLSQFHLVLLTNSAAYRPNLLARDFPPIDPIGSRSNGGHLVNIEYKYPVHSQIIHTLATVNSIFPRGETFFHLPPINILEIFKDFSSAPETFQRIFGLQNCLSRKSSTISQKKSTTFSPAKLS